MKHTDFLKSLKTLKSHLLQHKKTTATYIPLTSQNKQKSICTCKDAQGEFKYLYATQNELTYLLSKKDIKLYAYLCPYEKGWHLTKS